MKKWIYNALLIFFAVVFLGSAAGIVYYILDGNSQDQAYDDLSQLRDEALKSPITTQPGQDPVTPENPWVTVTDPEGEEISILPEFMQLYGMNSDLVGWITIDGTRIDYPVMWTDLDREDYYLRRNFYTKNASAGSIYVEEYCDVFRPSDNVTIYGHMMRNGTMFADLNNYKKKAFWEDHKLIRFSTLREHHNYEVFAVFVTTASIGKGFAYHSFDNAADKAEFDEFVNTCLKMSLYKTGITPQYGDKLITLSTCEYSRTNGRLVVVARRVD